MGFFSDLFGGDQGTENIPTQTKRQQDLTNAMLDESLLNFQKYKPSPYPSARTSPTKNEQSVFNNASAMNTRIGQRQADNTSSRAGFMNKARAAAGRGSPSGGNKASESNAEIINNGMSSIVKKILQNVNGGGK